MRSEGVFAPPKRRARRGDVGEHRFFLRSETFDGLDQVGDQIGPPLDHSIDLRPGGLDGFFLLHHRVAAFHVRTRQADADEQQHPDQILRR